MVHAVYIQKLVDIAWKRTTKSWT